MAINSEESLRRRLLISELKPSNLKEGGWRFYFCVRLASHGFSYENDMKRTDKKDLENGELARHFRALRESQRLSVEKCGNMLSTDVCLKKKYTDSDLYFSASIFIWLSQ